MLLFYTLVNTTISSLIINVPHMFGIKKKCNSFAKQIYGRRTKTAKRASKRTTTSWSRWGISSDVERFPCGVGWQ
jgi:hypothetical protein